MKDPVKTDQDPCRLQLHLKSTILAWQILYKSAEILTTIITLNIGTP